MLSFIKKYVMKKIGYELPPLPPINIEDIEEKIKIDYPIINFEVLKTNEWQFKKQFEDSVKEFKKELEKKLEKKFKKEFKKEFEKQLIQMQQDNTFYSKLFYDLSYIRSSDIFTARSLTSEVKRLISREIQLRGYKARKPDYLVWHGELSEYWDKCLDEVRRMREKGIDQNITFYDILVSEEANELASYVRNKNVAEALEGDSYKNDFPIYVNDLKRQFKIGNHRLSALNIGEIVTKHFGDFRQKEGPFNLKVAKYLSNEDIKNLRKAAIQTIDEYDMNTKVTDVSLSQPFVSRRFYK